MQRPGLTACFPGQATTSVSVTSDGVDPVPDNNMLSDFLSVTGDSSAGSSGGGGGRFDLGWLIALLSLQLATRAIARQAVRRGQR